MVERLQDEKRIETIRRKERNDLHIYTNIQVFLEDCFDSYLGIDLFDLEQPTFRTVKVKKNNNLEEVHQLLAETFVSKLKMYFNIYVFKNLKLMFLFLLEISIKSN